MMEALKSAESKRYNADDGNEVSLGPSRAKCALWDEFLNPTESELALLSNAACGKS